MTKPEAETRCVELNHGRAMTSAGSSDRQTVRLVSRADERCAVAAARAAEGRCPDAAAPGYAARSSPEPDPQHPALGPHLIATRPRAIAYAARVPTPCLWSWNLSPFAGKVRVAFAEKGVAIELIEIDPLKRPAKLRELNPTNRVPVLELDGTAVRESTAICEWLEDTHPEPPLWPADPAARATARGLLRWVDDELTANFFLSMRKEAFGLEAEDHPELVTILRDPSAAALEHRRAAAVADRGSVAARRRARHAGRPRRGSARGAAARPGSPTSFPTPRRSRGSMPG